MALLQGLHFTGPYYKILKFGVLVAWTDRGRRAPNFGWQVSVSIWITYGRFDLLDTLEVSNLEIGLRILSFISIVYYINFDGL